MHLKVIKSSNFLKITRPLCKRAKIVLRSFLVIFFAFLFTWEQAVALTSFHSESASINQQGEVSVSDNSFYSRNLPFHLLLESDPTSEKQGSSDDSESGDDFNDDVNVIACPSTYQNLLNSNYGNNAILFLNCSRIQNRISVPLFILHHSWKSFIS